MRRIRTTYISGPVSGIDWKEAEKRFRTAEKMIKERGEMVISAATLYG